MTEKTCQVDDAVLWNLVDPEHTTDDDPAILRHVEECAVCSQRLQEIHRLHAGLETIGQASPPPVPERIGEYEILRILGEGGMGVVYEAQQVSPRRRVAIKVLRPVAAPSDARLRGFRREIHALGRLNHARIATIYDAGKADDGQLYLVMELVEGVPLSRYHRANPARSVRQMAQLAAHVAQAVHHAHQRGVIHRDLKPANVLVDNEGKPHVLDFGLARFLDPAQEVTITRTGAGSPLGTLPYMSPEQFAGNDEDQDVRTDVYSLGVMLYEMLTDQLPYAVPSGRNGVAPVGAEAAPPHPSSIARRVPRELGDVVMKAIARDREHRYSSAAVLSIDLDRFLAGEAVSARPPSAVYRLRVFVRRHPAVAGLLVSLFLAVSTGLVLSQHYLRRTRALALASASAETRDTHPTLSLLLAREAVRQRPNLATLSALYAAVPQVLEHAVLRGHSAAVNNAIYSPSGRHILTISSDHTARLWTAEGELLRILEGHTDSVTKAKFAAPDGQRFLTGSMDGSVILWNLAGEHVAILSGGDGAIQRAEFSPDGLHVLTAAGRSARIWDLHGRELRRFDHARVVSQAAFSPDGKRVLTVGGASVDIDGGTNAHLWGDADEPLLLRGHTDVIVGVGFSADGDLVLTSSADRTARLWDLRGNCLHVLSGHNAPIVAARFSHDGSTILTATWESTIRLWSRDGVLQQVIDTGGGTLMGTTGFSPRDRWIVAGNVDFSAKLFDRDGKLQATLGHGMRMLTVTMSPDERRILTASRDGTARLWEVESDPPVLRGHRARVYAARATGNGKHIVSSSGDGTVRLWAATGQRSRILGEHDGWVTVVAWSPDETSILSAGEDCTARLWSRDGGLLRAFEHDGPVHGAAFSPDGRWIATGSFDRTLVIWDAETGERRAVLDCGHPVGDLAFSPDGDKILSTYRTRTPAHLWDWRRQEVLLEIPAARGGVAFHPSGEMFAAISDEGAALWNLEGQLVEEFPGDGEIMIMCAFSPDGKTLLAGVGNGARLWNLKGEELAVLRGHSGMVWGVSFSPDGKRMFTTSWDRTVRTWITDPDELIELADRKLERIGRRFTEAEREHFGDLIGR